MKVVIGILLTVCLISCNPTTNTQNDIVKNNFDFASKQLKVALNEMKIAVENESDESIHQRAVNG